MAAQDLRQAVFAYMDRQGMVSEGDTVYAAVSGGADSVCLLLLLAEYRSRRPFTLGAVHVEHGIRGEESLEDARFVEKLCAELDVPVHVARAAVPAFARQEGLSLEEAARICRYRVFENIASLSLSPPDGNAAANRRQENIPAPDVPDASGQGREGRMARVALAHHMEDQAETVLFNLARGTGLLGMGGMRPVRDRYIRPLLETRRDEIEAFLRKRGIAWREDVTNADPRYTRNLIRHSVLPVLTEGVNAQALAHICEAASYARAAADHLEREAERFCESYMHIEEASYRSGTARDRGADRGPGTASRQGGSGIRVILQVDPLRGQERILREQVLRRAVRLVRGGYGLKDVGAVHISDLDALIFKPRGKHLDLPGLLKAERVDRTIVLFLA